MAPENTLAAFKRGASYGYTMFECDVKLSSDLVPFLLHDAELDRTTNAKGVAGLRPWSELQKLDAGSWHSENFKGEGLISLKSLANYVMSNGFDLNIEIKPTPGQEEETGYLVAKLAKELWANHPRQPLLTSFSKVALSSANEVAPELSKGLLAHHWQNDTLDIAHALGCAALVCHHEQWTQERLNGAHKLGLRGLSYTVNDELTVGRLKSLGLDGIITDRVDLFRPN